MEFKKKLLYSNCLAKITTFYQRYIQVRKKKFGYFSKTARVRYPIRIKGIENVFMYDYSHILGNALIISTKAKFIMKQYSGAAEGLTVVTGNHFSTLGEWRMNRAGGNDEQVAKDVIVEEDVWLGANVTLLAGVIVGRGATVGAGSVCVNSVPPYAIVMGNPAKVIGFNFTPEEVIEHEKALYPESERLQIDVLKKNYKKYLSNRTNEIKSFFK